jgi:hypothetical protein
MKPRATNGVQHAVKCGRQAKAALPYLQVADVAAKVLEGDTLLAAVWLLSTLLQIA